MSQFLKQNLYQPKNLTENRMLLLTQKINSLKIGQNADAERKVDALEKQTNDLEKQMQKMMISFNDKHFELKHILGKINKELSFDYVQTDCEIKEQTIRCQEKAHQLIEAHIGERKDSDARISRFIDEKCAIFRDLIERQIKERSNCINEIQDSLTRDLSQIREKSESQTRLSQGNIEEIHQQFLTQYEKIHCQFTELSQKYNASEAQFYKMLRDILKKVKVQIGESKRQRQEMEESILVLIQRLCDKAMEQVKIK